MKTVAAFAFFFYWGWAPLLTIAVVTYALRRLQMRLGSILSLLLPITFLTVVAGPVGIDGPLPGYMPWWAVDVIAKGQHQQNYVAPYAAAVAAALFVGLGFKAMSAKKD